MTTIPNLYVHPPSPKRGRPSAFEPKWQRPGVLAIGQGAIHGIEVSYDPDHRAWSIHNPDGSGEVLYRFDARKKSGIRNVVQKCREISQR